jgi:adenylate cyclase
VEVSIYQQLSPRDQHAADVNAVLAQSYYFDRDYERCVAACEHQLNAFPGYGSIYGILAAALGQLGRAEEARAALGKLKTFLGDQFNPGNRILYYRIEDHEHRLEGLRKAGWEG